MPRPNTKKINSDDRRKKLTFPGGDHRVKRWPEHRYKTHQRTTNNKYERNVFTKTTDLQSVLENGVATTDTRQIVDNTDTDIYTIIHAHSDTDRQTDRQTYIHADRWTDIHRHNGKRLHNTKNIMVVPNSRHDPTHWITVTTNHYYYYYYYY